MTTVYTFNNKVLKNSATDKWLKKEEAPVDPYNPLGLPPNTVRVRTSDCNAPYKHTSQWGSTSYETATLVPGTNDVYDLYKSGTDFSNLLYNTSISDATNVIEVLGANTTGITNMSSMFFCCVNLTTIPLFDTSSVTNMEGMFGSCTKLTTIPLFNTSNVTNMSYMVNDCSKVESGALALYQQASTQTTPPSNHQMTFYNCGIDTTSGAAELAQIPSDWK